MIRDLEGRNHNRDFQKVILPCGHLITIPLIGEKGDNTRVAKIAIITPRTHPNLSYLSRYLEERGHTVFIFVEAATPDFQLHEGSRTQIVAKDTFSNKELCEVLESIELALVRSYQGFPGAIYRQLRNRRDVRFVEYSQAPMFVPKLSILRDYLRAGYRLLRGRPKRSITCVLGNSKRDKGLPFSSYFPHPGPKFRKAPAIPASPSEAIRIVSIAKHGVPRKRLDLLLDALIRLGFRGHLTLIGMDTALATAQPRKGLSLSERQHSRRVGELMSAATATFEVEKCSNLSHSEALDQIRESDLFVLPSVREPFAISPLEAMALGKAVIISSDNGATDYVENGRSGFVFKSDQIFDLSNCIAASFDSKRRLEMGRVGRKVATRMNGDNRLAQIINEILREAEDD